MLPASRTAVKLLLLVFGAAFASGLLAQGYPARPVKVVVAFAPGTTSDIIGRMFSERLSQATGQPFVVENRTGAGGTIGAEFVATSAADGYTLLVSTAALPVSAAVYRNLKYDTAKDFASVTVMSHSPLALAANLNFPPRTVGELVAYARTNPGKVNFGSAGIGTSHHLTGEKFKLATGVDIVHVPYKGSAPAHADLLGGQIQIMFDNIVALMPHFKAGKLRPMAVTSARRNPQLPDVPSVQEAGVRDFETVAWFGFVAPAGTPREILVKLNAGVRQALAQPEVRQRLIDTGSDIIGNSPEAADRQREGRVVILADAEAVAAAIPDGAFIALPPDYSLPAMAVIRSLILRNARNLRLLGVPVLGMSADLLIGAGCVAEVETSAVSLGEAGLAPRFNEAVEKGEIVVRDATCPAIHTALQATEKGVPFMPLRGVLGSDLINSRSDWAVVNNPMAKIGSDPILLVPAISPDIALFHARWADEAGNVWVGRRRELATIAHAAKQTFVTYEELREGDMLEDELMAPGVISSIYVMSVAPAVRGAWPLGVAGLYDIDDAHLAHYAAAARTRAGFQRYLDEFVCIPEKNSSPASSPA